MNKFKETAIAAARAGGKILLDNLGKLAPNEISGKAQFDFVTRVDKESEQCIIGILREAFPEHSFLAEEMHRDTIGGYRWVVDPLDGTTNYIHGVPIFSVSIALEKDGEPILGVVLDPIRDELFYAEKGAGAWLNGRRIQVSSVSNPEFALLATGFPFRVKHLLEVYQRSFNRLFMQVSGIRRAGSAALDLCYVACGRFDGFWELNLKRWDIA
ncbi:MAG: inositol monophosphatase, partial [candidate division KSB1 bacterium]|nr:inositol monophosphatase [candidate division KSB1 bacterium]